VVALGDGDATEEAADAAEDSADEATERAEDAAEEAALEMDDAAEESDAEIEERAAEMLDEAEAGAVAVADPLRDAAELEVLAAGAEEGAEEGAGAAATENAGLLARMLFVLDASTRLSIYDPGTTWGNNTAAWLLCGLTLFARARPPGKV